MSSEGTRRPTHLKKRFGTAVLALVILGGTVVGGAAGGHPTAAEAFSCPLQTLSQGPVYSGTNQVGTVLLLKNACDGSVFARFSTPYWFSQLRHPDVRRAHRHIGGLALLRLGF